MTALDLCNNALALLKEPPMDGFDPNGHLAQRMCYLHYHPTRKEVLRAHNWLFAVGKSTIYGKSEWKNTDNRRYNVPDLCLKIIRVQPEGAQEMDWQPTIHGRAFRLPYRYRSATITYIKDEEDLDLWSADALFCFTHLLAAKMCIPLINSTTLRTELMAQYDNKLKSITNPTK